MDMICQCNKQKILKFKGGLNPLVYKEWFRKLKHLFEIKECPGTFEVCVATYQYEKEAEFWWGMLKPQASKPLLIRD